ncbi:MAG TPA: vanadium-dependent haloperoxidase [Polaromonas sp.]|jgi:hypothetical protein
MSRYFTQPMRWLGASLFIAYSACTAIAAEQQASVVSKWNSVALNEIVLNNSAPYKNARQLAILNLSLYNAIEAVKQKHELFQVSVAPAPDASAEAAAAAAGYTALTSLFPKTNETYLSTTYYNELARIPEGPAKSKGIALGQEVAQQVLASRKDDGGNDPAKPFGEIKPIALTSAAQFFVPPPPDSSNAQLAIDINRSKSLGERDSKARTPEQTEIALFWSNTGVGTYGSAGHSLRIGQTLAQQKNLSLADEARLLALLSIALSDGAVSSVYWKNQYKSQRPVEFIRAGDPQARLVAQPDWEPLSPAAGLDYPSTLTTYAGATTAVLQTFFKTDKLRFTLDSVSLPGVKRSYTSISAATHEAANSRIYSGYHTAAAVRSGRELLGPAIGQFVADNFLKPKRQLVASR